MSSRKVSSIWDFFTINSASKQTAVCNLCKTTLSYKSTSANLKKHILKKHPTVKVRAPTPPSTASSSSSRSPVSSSKNISQTYQDQEFHNESESEDDIVAENLTSASPLQTKNNNNKSAKVENTDAGMSKKTSTVVQTHIHGYFNQKMTSSNKRKADDALLLLFTHDFQPFSIVDDYGFRNFVATICPSYQLPTRKTIRSTYLSAAYEEAYNNAKTELENIMSITLTTDCWTSCNTENFMAVTVHFINPNFELKSLLLDCSSFNESHTAINLAGQLKETISEWNLHEKILLAVSDHAANICKAIKEILKLKHFGCFAHAVNLIARDALKLTSAVIEKVKTIVSYFKRSTNGTAKLNEQQKRQGRNPKQLKQDVSTRWNSTYYMLERFTELEEAIRTTMALTGQNLPIISNEEWTFFKELVEILKPLEAVTNIMSGENYLTASSVIIMTDGLVNVYTQLGAKEFTELANKVVVSILTGIKNRLGELEGSNSLVLSRYLFRPEIQRFGIFKS